MQIVSEDWKNAHKQTLLNESFVEISFDITDPDALEDATPSDNGAIYISNSSEFSMELSASTGNIIASGVSCDGDVKLSVTTGKNTLTDVRCKSLTSDGGTGDILLKNVTVSEKLSVNRNTGDVTLDGSDAAELYIRTITGHVKGTLLSEKIFVVETNTGKKDVPNTLAGGKCEIKSNTGDIKISIK